MFLWFKHLTRRIVRFWRYIIRTFFYTTKSGNCYFFLQDMEYDKNEIFLGCRKGLLRERERHDTEKHTKREVTLKYIYRKTKRFLIGCFCRQLLN
jgi:hypothetical protein